MYTLEITVHRPGAGNRAQEQLARSYRGQPGTLRENLNVLDHPTIEIPVPDVAPAAWLAVVYGLLPEDAVSFRVFEEACAPGQVRAVYVPRTWLVLEDRPWPKMPAPLPAEHSLRKHDLGHFGSIHPTVGNPLFHKQAEHLLRIDPEWKTFRTTDLAGEPVDGFPVICLGPTGIVEGPPAA